MAGMSSFMTKFGGGYRPPTSSFSTYEDPSADAHKEAVEKFIIKFGQVTEKYEFKFKNNDGSEDVVSIRFDKDAHTYYRLEVDDATGQAYEVKILGITNVVGVKDKSKVLMTWAANETANYVRSEFLSLDPEHTAVIRSSDLMFQEWLFSTLTEAQKNYEALSKAATDVGHAAHDWLENHVKALIANDQDALAFNEANRPRLPEKAISCCEAALSWMRLHNVRWKFTERKVYSRKYDAAGTLDGVCLVDSCDDPECCPKPFKDILSVIDWKSSNALYDSYRWQTASYQAFIMEELGLEIKHRWLIQLGKYDGAFKKWHITEEDYEMDLRCFVACLNLVKVTEHANRTLVNRRAAERAVKKAAREAAEAIEKAERLRCREGRKAARLKAKEVYRRHRANGHSVVSSEMASDSWLTEELAKFGVTDEEETERAVTEAA